MNNPAPPPGPIGLPVFGPAYRHVCMMEGPDPDFPLSTLRYDSLLRESKRQADELQHLKALLRKHNIEPDTSTSVTVQTPSSDATVQESERRVPRLPIEILLRILGFALTSPVPVIDPFYKIRIQNVTTIERFSRQYINVGCLGVSRVFNVEGTRILMENNRFVFTQAAALDNFAKISPQLRANVKNVTLRVVGRYYSDVYRTEDFSGNSGHYHHTVPALQAYVLARPDGMINDQGIQAYCWLQVADFLKALQLPWEHMTQNRPKLLPGLETMRLDLVNFCDHLPVGISSFAAVVRWHLGRIVDELVVSGMPGSEEDSDELMVLRNLLRTDGLFSSACASFVSIKDGVKTLPTYGYNHHIPNSKVIGKKAARKAPIQNHPEGGQPPKSAHKDGTTIWKWTKDFEDEPKKWIEFDRASGRPMSEVEEDEDDDDISDHGAQFGFAPMVLPAVINGMFPPSVFQPPSPIESSDEEEGGDGADSEGMPELIDLD